MKTEKKKYRNDRVPF